MENSAFFPQVSEMLKEKFLLEEGGDYSLYSYYKRFEKTFEKCWTFSVVLKTFEGTTVCRWCEAEVDGYNYLFMNIHPKKRQDIGWAWSQDVALRHIEKTINSGNSLQEFYRRKLLEIRGSK
ncbi:hypothetical protein B1750_gp450 [Noumeavirus]|uniref:hypothetical protein n=1 Tax=Noumeavirus TaxID=1955558 RepID=UPI000982E150|nr:hypothetical protein B1750_gp450 [Noumeavirus]AQM73431.1 hypothetical protein NMV_450 [Noumeavirus]